MNTNWSKKSIASQPVSLLFGELKVESFGGIEYVAVNVNGQIGWLMKSLWDAAPDYDDAAAYDTKNSGVINDASNVHPLKRRASRRDRFEQALAYVSEARSTAEDLRDELQNWVDNMPENLQGGSKADEINDAISSLEDVISGLEDVEGQDVSFPGMR